ncbi:MAG: mechanosensitive ion channel [Bacillota bacterium]|nr:mechanosensitive ion channel [Bacillota bacterium]
MSKKSEEKKAKIEEKGITQALVKSVEETKDALDANRRYEERKKSKKEARNYFIFFVVFAAFCLAYILLDRFLPSDTWIYPYLFDEANHVTAKILSSIQVLMVVEGIAYLIRIIIVATFAKRSHKAVTISRLASSGVKYIAGIGVILGILSVWGVDTATLIASAGVLALIVGLGAQTLIADVIAGIEIVFEDQFQVGDVVVIDSFRGTVTEISLSCVKLEDMAKNLKVIRNNQINTVVNLSRQLSTAVCDFTVSYDTDFVALRKLIEDDLPNLRVEFPIIQEDPLFLGYQELGLNGVTCRMIARIKEDDKFDATRKLNEHYLLLLKKNNIQIVINQIQVSQKQK